ncbi:MAG: type IV toxin-antitoxin system AbiEi family antitoxin domain-containing protein, partial [Actinomycetota bacterium]|nr:type IV toxin-antitoxin system AbiEi family antitoxin domain-containing protein [Actinomycetota bacterium]
MSRPTPSACAERTLNATSRASALAGKQGGRITRAQLVRCGLSEWQITRWHRNGRLVRIGGGVYALGHRAMSAESPLIEALLRAGEGSALSHGTCLWWRDLIRFAPAEIHVSAPGRRRSAPGLVIHHPRSVDREWSKGLPVVPVAEALLGAAPSLSLAGLRRAIALVDKRGLMTLPELESLATSEKRGSRDLRGALAVHMPELARTRSPLEDRFLLLCERFELELPIPNFVVAGYEVDAVWPDLGLGVELDGRDEH